MLRSTYGVVLKVQRKDTGEFFAIKKFKESDDDEQVKKTAYREVRLLRQLRHHNIVSLVEVFRSKRKLHLVFEFVDHTVLKTLQDCAEGLDPTEVKKIMYQLVSAVDFCHSQKVVHRDIKPENLLISRHGILKLCDFGFARELNAKNGRYTEYVSTRWYRAPELLVGDANYGKAVDIWAIGCLHAELLTGIPLFPGESDIDTLYHIMKTCGNVLTQSHVETFKSNPNYEGCDVICNQSFHRWLCL